MRILVLTTLYPNSQMPRHGIFVENRLRALQSLGDVAMEIIAPVPWLPKRLFADGRFPILNEKFSAWKKWSQVPLIEERHGITVHHPRYFIPPKVGMTYAPYGLEKCFRKKTTELMAAGKEFDLIDAHYYYPDGVAAVRLAKTLNLPVTVTARGTDINYIPQFKRQKEMILQAAAHADASITVAQALNDEMGNLGATKEKIHTLRNGVDLENFKPLDRDEIRRRLNLSGPVIASIGHLIERKGNHLLIEALADLKEVTLILAGDGPEQHALEALALEKNVQDRVRFLGAIPHDKLSEIYNAADILALASSREGWPNVLLEAMACGTPCVATNIWGSGEVITEKAAGLLATQRTAKSIGDAIKSLLKDLPKRETTRAYAERFSWDETAHRLKDLFTSLIEEKKTRKAVLSTPAIHTTKTQQPVAIVTVDTEERFDWQNFHTANYSVCDAADVNHFQSRCELFDIKPIYFITHPLMDNDQTADYFNELYKEQKATLGLHMHQWVTPPLENLISPYYSFQKNIPEELHREKFKSLIDTYIKKFNHTPNMHRAGRYGIAPENYDLLSQMGIQYDFSPSAGFDFSKEGGPDFSGMDNTPFIVHPNTSKSIIVTPVSGINVIRHSRLFSKIPGGAGFNNANATSLRHTIPPRTIMRLSPEGNDLDDMVQMAKHLIKQKTPIITFTLHSTTLTIGANSYTPTAQSVHSLLDNCEQFFSKFQTELGGQFISSDELKILFTDHIS